ncbi:hypothetical protein [Pseudomonas sp. R5(2019)]|uniref:hypothetical protein n=1 Tax=Pseudomonas sp. R5(2019) TaxID=2697566 RepID=UPI00141250E2|nr:hypothetical protein [Pseudomonas sp. R5(2019)]NBA95015.1 hypothetical protein [Pseudomonas sp. R5(2019)]
MPDRAFALGIAWHNPTELLQDLARHPHPTWLFLDDYCRTPHPELDALLQHSNAHIS